MAQENKATQENKTTMELIESTLLNNVGGGLYCGIICHGADPFCHCKRLEDYCGA